MLKRKDGRWQEQIKLPGMEKPKYFYGKTQKEVKHKIAEWQKDQEVSENFDKVADSWYDEHEKLVEYSTYVSYRPSMDRAKDFFGNKPVKNIMPDEVNAYIINLANRGYSKHTVEVDKTMLNMIFNYAIINRFMMYNPCAPVKIPKGLPKTSRDLPTDEQLKKVVDNTDIEFGLFPIMLFYTGLRRAELMALQWDDIDWNRRTITVSKSVYFIGNSPMIKVPKTPSGFRDVFLLDALADIIPRKTGKAYIFGGSAPMKKSEVRRRWLSWCKEVGLAEQVERITGKQRDGVTDKSQMVWKPLITPHQLRHAHATILYDAGVSAKDAQYLLGHASIQITMDIYTHIRKNRQKSTAEKLNLFITNGEAITINSNEHVGDEKECAAV